MTWRGRHTHILLGVVLVGTLGGQAWAFEPSGVVTRTAFQSPEIGAPALVSDVPAELKRGLEYGMGPTFSNEQGMFVPPPAQGNRDRSLSGKADGQVIHLRDRNESHADTGGGVDLHALPTPEGRGVQEIRTTDGGILGRLQVLPIAFGDSGTEAPDGLVILAF